MEIYLNDVFPYVQQIACYIENSIYKKELQPGEKLPIIIDFSKQLKISSSTISTAYEILRKKGLIVKKGKFYFVTEDISCIISEMKEAIDLCITRCLHEMVEMGASKEQLKLLINRKISKLDFPK